jgi:hypothetical protein
VDDTESVIYSIAGFGSRGVENFEFFAIFFLAFVFITKLWKRTL